MIKKKIEQMKSLIVKKDNVSNNKKIENLIFFLIILIITIIAINVIWKDDNKKDKVTNTNSNKQLALEETQNSNTQNTNSELENNLKQILSKMQGVGDVEVLITYSETSKTVPMYNEDSTTSYTEEEDSTGGTRKTQQTDTSKEVIYQEISGEQKPMTQSILMPKIEGAIIIAQGASNSAIKSNIIQAVEAATGLATHKIQVFEFSK